jgi:hypothetical protein
VDSIRHYHPIRLPVQIVTNPLFIEDGAPFPQQVIIPAALMLHCLTVVFALFRKESIAAICLYRSKVQTQALMVFGERYQRLTVVNQVLFDNFFNVPQKLNYGKFMKLFYSKKISIVVLLCLALSVPILSGCGSKRVPPEGMPTLYRCSVQITQNGQPLTDAVVTLHSTSEHFPWTINGRTDEKGQAEIFTHGYFKGAPKGNFKVTVDKLETVIPPLPEVMPTSEQELTELFNKREEEIKEYRLVDVMFTQEESTPFFINVNKKMGVISLDLSSTNNQNGL